MDDIAILGAGAFAARILFDLAATTTRHVNIAVIGRNPEKLRWMRTAALARARMFNRSIAVRLITADLGNSDDILKVMRESSPRVAVQSASTQTASIIGTSANAWTALIARTGLSLTAPLQGEISIKVARAIAELGLQTRLINCCYPDVVNAMIKGLGLPVASGLGNVAILSEMFGGMLEPGERQVSVLAPYQAVGPWRKTPEHRLLPAPARVWIDGKEVEDIYERFRGAQLTAVPVIDISGASGVTLIGAMAAGEIWRGHVPGPNGLPGGYPVTFDGSEIALDLPAGLTEAEAIGWNLRYEEAGGMVVDANGTARYTGALKTALAEYDCPLSEGFALADLDDAVRSLHALRTRLLAQTV